MILVTGGTGLLGSYVVKELLRRGQEVRVLARRESERRAQELGAQIAFGDLADVESVRSATKDVSAIIHTACTFTDHHVDIAAMSVLLDAWDQGAFVFISSVDVYGVVQGGPITEQHPTIQAGAASYGQGKVSCEKLLMNAAQQRGRGDWSILRPPHIWAPDPRCLRHSASPTTELYAKVCDGAPLVLPGAAPSEWSHFGDDWIDARELAGIAVDCVTKPLAAAANTINSHFIWHDFCMQLIRSADSRSQLEHKDLGEITPAELSSKAFFANTWHYSGDRLRQHLNFQPAHRWQDVLETAIANDH